MSKRTTKGFTFLGPEWIDDSTPGGRAAELHFAVPASMESEVDQTPCMAISDHGRDGLRLSYQHATEAGGDDCEFYCGPDIPREIIASAEAARKAIEALAALDQDCNARTIVHMWLEDCFPPAGSLLGLNRPIK